MGPVVISVVVVGACIAIAGWLVIDGRTGEPAMPVARRGRGAAVRAVKAPPEPPRAAAAVAVLGGRWTTRVRSVLLLGCLATALGVLAAAAVGVVVVVLFALLQSSVG